ncbi:MAG: uroporphyrinogen decarboxylase family protein [Treponema sp.]|nr:uroporphyrinogen decarboxylase family protein [Treponema sp.]
MAAILTDMEKKETLEAVWRLEETREVPFVIETGPFHGATTAFFDDPAAEVTWSEEQNRNREGVYDYGLPNIKPNQGIGIVAAAFGCKFTVNDEADPWITPLIKEENVEDVYTLEIPDVETNEIFRRVWKRIDALQNLSSMPLRMVNVPSPLVTASMIWDYTSFIEGILTYPDEVHALLDKVTQATILFIREQFKRITNLYSVGHESIYFIPRSAGVRVSDDTAALLSPDMYREFGVKYNNMISGEFGGIVVHSCGDIQHVVPAMMEIEGLKGLDFTAPQVMNWNALRDAAAGKITLCLRQRYWDHPQDASVDLADYARKIMDTFGRKGLIIETSAATAEEARVLGEKLHKLLSR